MALSTCGFIYRVWDPQKVARGYLVRGNPEVSSLVSISYETQKVVSICQGECVDGSNEELLIVNDWVGSIYVKFVILVLCDGSYILLLTLVSLPSEGSYLFNVI